MDAGAYRSWCVSEEELAEVTPLKARDFIVECFMAAQKETFAQAKGSLGLPVDDESLRRSVVGAVRSAFKDVGGSFEEPDKASVARAIDVLASSAAAWGTPPEIVEHHHEEILRVVDRLSD